MKHDTEQQIHEGCARHAEQPRTGWPWWQDRLADGLWAVYETFPVWMGVLMGIVLFAGIIKSSLEEDRQRKQWLAEGPRNARLFLDLLGVTPQGQVLCRVEDGIVKCDAAAGGGFVALVCAETCTLARP